MNEELVKQETIRAILTDTNQALFELTNSLATVADFLGEQAVMAAIEEPGNMHQHAMNLRDQAIQAHKIAEQIRQKLG